MERVTHSAPTSNPRKGQESIQADLFPDHLPRVGLHPRGSNDLDTTQGTRWCTDRTRFKRLHSRAVLNNADPFVLKAVTIPYNTRPRPMSASAVLRCHLVTRSRFERPMLKSTRSALERLNCWCSRWNRCTQIQQRWFADDSIHLDGTLEPSEFGMVYKRN